MKKEHEEELEKELEEKDVKVKVEIIMLNNGSVRVKGPVDNQSLVTSLIGAGLNSLAMHWAKKKAEESKIITPGGLVMPGMN